MVSSSLSLSRTCLLLLVACGVHHVAAWTHPPLQCPIARLSSRSHLLVRHYSDPNKDDISRKDDENNNNSNNNNHKDENSMSIVRALQDNYYKTTPSTPSCRLDLSGGQVLNLPIWTRPWHEVPGRSNVLHVHEGAVTHMMETILRSNPPVWYLGHVYRGSHSKKKQQRPLQGWSNVTSLSLSSSSLLDRVDNSAGVVGTLLRITDYRRMADGRLLVLVQALERFVVDQVTQSAPYAVANVQLVPDLDEEDNDNRVDAVWQSFQKWHRYEFENTMLPLPLSRQRDQDDDDDGVEDEYLDNSQIVGSALAQVLPYAPYSSVVDTERLARERVESSSSSDSTTNNNEPSKNHAFSLEQELQQRGILSTPILEPDVQKMTCDQLEYALWVCMDRFLKRTKRAVSPVLLGLLPRDQTWPRGFVLERIVVGIQEQHQLDHKMVRVTPHYPARRRQKRLSYAAAALLEQDEYQAQSCRLQLLQIPTTHDRLAYVLQNLRERTEGTFE